MRASVFWIHSSHLHTVQGANGKNRTRDVRRREAREGGAKRMRTDARCGPAQTPSACGKMTHLLLQSTTEPKDNKKESAKQKGSANQTKQTATHRKGCSISITKPPQNPAVRLTVMDEEMCGIRPDHLAESPLLLGVQAVAHVSSAQLVAEVGHGGRHAIGGDLSVRGRRWGGNRGGAARCTLTDTDGERRGGSGAGRLLRSATGRRSSRSTASQIARSALNGRQRSSASSGGGMSDILRRLLLLLRSGCNGHRGCLLRLRRLLRLRALGEGRPESAAVARHDL